MNTVIDKYSALLFDLDGTIADSMPIHNRAWMEVLGEDAKHITNEILQSYAGMSSLKMVSLLNQRFGLKLDPELISHKKELLFLKNLHEVTLIESVFAVIKNFSHKPMAIVSGGTRENVSKTLTLLKLNSYFTHLVCAGETELGKPHPDPFLKAATLLMIDPAQCLVFEDAEPGIIGAKKAGMGVIRVGADHKLTIS